MEIVTKKENGIFIVMLKGRLDSQTKNKYEKEILPLIGKKEKDIIIDLSELDYISSAGLRMLLVSAKSVKKASGKIVIHSMKDFIREIFDISGFSRLFDIVDNREKALEEFK